MVGLDGHGAQVFGDHRAQVARRGLGEQRDSRAQPLDQGNLNEPKSKKSKALVAMAPLLAKYLRSVARGNRFRKSDGLGFRLR